MSRAPFADRIENLSGNAIREILKLIQQPDMISFAGGLPSPEAFPMKEIKEITTEIMDKADTSLVQYSVTEGYGPLRAYIAQWLGSKGIKVTADEVLILSGSQQGIDLLGKTFLNKGDKVIVEDPTYLAALQIFKTYEAQFTAVESDEEGIREDSLKEILEQGDHKLLYLVPTFQNPTGKTLSEKRRRSLMELVKNYNITVIEDDPYGDLRYTGEEIPLLKSFDTKDQVVYLGSFSKIIAPGLRVGFAVAPKDILSKMIIGKQATDVHTSNLSQQIVYEFCNRGLLQPHIKKIRQQYKSKLALMLKLIVEFFPKEIKWTTPEGGLFIWLQLPEGVSTAKMLEEAVLEKVAFIPGESFFASGKGQNTIRLNFSNATLEEIQMGMERLGKIMKRFI